MRQQPSENRAAVISSLKRTKFGQTAVARHLLDVGPDLGGRCIFARPVVIGLERKLVLARQDIDKEAGKGVVPPGTADFAGLFVNDETDPGALQCLGHEQPRHPRTGDDNTKILISHPARQTARMSAEL